MLWCNMELDGEELLEYVFNFTYLLYPSVYVTELYDRSRTLNRVIKGLHHFG